MPPPYIEIQISAHPELVERLIAIMSQLGFEGFWEDESLLKCYISATRWNPALANEVRTTVTRMQLSSTTPRPVITVRVIEDRNWNEDWETTIAPIRVTDRIVIKPTWQEFSPSPGDLVITIDPKMSFGTGYHESTRLVLRLMEQHLHAGCRLLDVGTGTGILAIAGLKLGATLAVAVDVDEWSYENALENSRLNHVEDSLTVVRGDMMSVAAGSFDLILANIQLNVIAPLLPAMKARMTGAGVLLLSGLLLDDRDDLLGRLSEQGLVIREEMRENEWMAVAVGGERGPHCDPRAGGIPGEGY